MSVAANGWPGWTWPYLPALLRASIGAGGGGVAGSVGGKSGAVTTQREDGSWTITPAEAAKVHSAGGVVLWLMRPGGAEPTADDGVAPGDAINGTVSGSAPASITTVTVPASAAPAKRDAPGTAEDMITLTRVTGISWAVGPANNRTHYPASAFTGATMDVPWTGGGTVEVMGVPEPGYALSGTSAWSLTFTNDTSTTTTTVTVPAGAAPVGDDQPGVNNDKVTLTQVTGVQWVVNGANIPDGTTTVPIATGAAATVTATAKPGFALSGTTTWTVPFTDAAASPWTLAAEIDFTQPTSGGTTYTALDGTTLSASKGTIEVSNGMLQLLTGNDVGYEIGSSLVDVGPVWAMEWSVQGRPEAWNRYATSVGRSDFWASAPIGAMYDGAAGAIVAEDGSLTQLVAVPENKRLGVVPITTEENVIRMEVDTVALKMKFIVNGADSGTYDLVSAPAKTIKFNANGSAYASSGMSYRYVRFYRGVA